MTEGEGIPPAPSAFRISPLQFSDISISSGRGMEAVAEPTGRDTGHLSHRRYWLALYRRDVDAAARVVRACRERWSPARIYLRLFEPALALSGSLWAKGAIRHEDEHFVTHHTARFMRQVRRDLVPREPTGPLALAVSAGQNAHSIGLQMVCDFLQAGLGWRVAWPPANGRATVGNQVEWLCPAALLVSISLDPQLDPARRLIADQRRRGFTGLVAVGGAAVNCDPARVGWLGADLTARNGIHLVRLLRSRLRGNAATGGGE